MILDLNLLVSDKAAILNLPPNKMSSFQKDIYWSHKELETAQTKGFMFISESDLKEKKSWTKSNFNLAVGCHKILTILRTLGKTREIREKGILRILFLE